MGFSEDGINWQTYQSQGQDEVSGIDLQSSSKYSTNNFVPEPTKTLTNGRGIDTAGQEDRGFLKPMHTLISQKKECMLFELQFGQVDKNIRR